MVRRPNWSSERGWEVNLEVWEWSEGPPKGPGGFGRPTRRSGWSREAHPEVREGSKGPPGGPGGIGRPT